MTTVASAGRRDRQDDVAQHLQRVGAVHARRILQLRRQGQEELAQQEDVEGVAEEGRHDQRQEGVDPSELVEEHEERHHRHRVGQHQRGKQQEEEEVLAGCAQPGKAVGHDGARQQMPDDGAQR